MSNKLSAVDILELVKSQNQKWIKVGEFEFLYQKLNSEAMIELVQTSSSDKKTSKKDEKIDVKFFVNIMSKSIIDWKNVKLKNLMEEGVEIEGVDLEQEVEFSFELLDAFLRENFSLFPQILASVSESVSLSAKKNEELKKK